MQVSETVVAGRALDALVAEKVMGWRRGRSYANGNGEWMFPDGTLPHFRNDWDGTPHYSTDIAAAWMVARHLIDRGYHITIQSSLTAHDGTRHRVEFIGWPMKMGTFYHYGHKATVEEAICRAALATVDEA